MLIDARAPRLNQVVWIVDTDSMQYFGHTVDMVGEHCFRVEAADMLIPEFQNYYYEDFGRRWFTVEKEARKYLTSVYKERRKSGRIPVAMKLRLFKSWGDLHGYIYEDENGDTY